MSEKRWEERGRDPVSIFLITSVRPLPEKPFLVSKWQNVWCGSFKHSPCLFGFARAKPDNHDIYEELVYRKGALKTMLTNSNSLPSRGFRKPFLIRFASSLEPGTGEFFIASYFRVFVLKIVFLNFRSLTESRNLVGISMKWNLQSWVWLF